MKTFFTRLGVFLIGVPVGLCLAVLCLVVGAAFAAFGALLVLVFAAFFSLVFATAPFVRLFTGRSLVKAITEELNKI